MSGSDGRRTREPDGGGAAHAVTVTADVEAAFSARAEAEAVVNRLTPWGLSIVFHLGLVLLAVFVAWAVVPPAVLDDDLPVEQISRHRSSVSAKLMSATQKPSKRASAVRSVAPRSAAADGRKSSAFFGSTAGPSTYVGIGGGGGGGARSPFGDGALTAGGPTSGMFGIQGGQAERIAYLIDASGSLIDTFPFVIDELKRSIGKLDDRQQFTVIFYQGDNVKEVPPAGMKTATPETKQRVIAWIDTASGNVIPGGGTNPLVAMRLALQQRPQLLYILSDNITGSGRFEVDRGRLLADIVRTNAAATRIHTIQYLYPDPLAAKGMKATLELISEQSGGTYKYVDARELRIR